MAHHHHYNHQSLVVICRTKASTSIQMLMYFNLLRQMLSLHLSVWAFVCSGAQFLCSRCHFVPVFSVSQHLLECISYNSRYGNSFNLYNEDRNNTNNYNYSYYFHTTTAATFTIAAATTIASDFTTAIATTVTHC